MTDKDSYLCNKKKDMILDSVKSFEKYKGLVPGFDKVYEFLRKNDLNKLEEGRHEIDGNRVFCTIESGELRGFDMESCPLEIHDSYIDIHVLLDGAESFGIKDRCLCVDKEAKYDQEKDIAFLPDAPDSFVSLGVNNLLIIYPSDAHSPLMGEGNYKKAVFKVLVEIENDVF